MAAFRELKSRQPRILCIRSLILDSPLPELVNIDEQELANFNEALTSVLVGNDSTLLDRFHSYFGSLGRKVFTIDYPLKDGKTVTLSYSRTEMLSILLDKVAVHTMNWVTRFDVHLSSHVER